jgi:hypothetical protein
MIGEGEREVIAVRRCAGYGSLLQARVCTRVLGPLGRCILPII